MLKIYCVISVRKGDKLKDITQDVRPFSTTIGQCDFFTLRRGGLVN